MIECLPVDPAARRLGFDSPLGQVEIVSPFDTLSHGLCPYDLAVHALGEMLNTNIYEYFFKNLILVQQKQFRNWNKRINLKLRLSRVSCDGSGLTTYNKH